ncbi:hypothetical protein [Croceimicrobium hydrocarbonivorans]|uniref:Uncharacterized protein n=1 Tax=Croceimicrobium hydrocarbonivorans TaxID=2761580 RepID=A0A7H0VDK7_9FLAO|nr:hypothetical protein [Croceimicrobium hydrocarbonivorans]QNR23805.1 hypothetical protein H4K34_15725 [Croceimicrobium hydrocarbonivorans]
MSAFISLLEKQKKRELQHQFDLPSKAKNTEWLTLQEVEGQAQKLYDRIVALLPNNISLVRQEVQLQTYKTPNPAARMQIRANISASNHRSYVLKIHCHELNPKGNMTKVARAEYHYKETRRSMP